MDLLTYIFILKTFQNIINEHFSDENYINLNIDEIIKFIFIEKSEFYRFFIKNIKTEALKMKLELSSSQVLKIMNFHISYLVTLFNTSNKLDNIDQHRIYEVSKKQLKLLIQHQAKNDH